MEWKNRLCIYTYIYIYIYIYITTNSIYISIPENIFNITIIIYIVSMMIVVLKIVYSIEENIGSPNYLQM